ncbi:MAG: hypothetical protein N3G22_01020 [Candidatus Micrarchaeota archaeon]|nr:hypothetical protein [Candidatus Micrarchaeota archaeon]
MLAQKPNQTGFSLREVYPPPLSARPDQKTLSKATSMAVSSINEDPALLSEISNTEKKLNANITNAIGDVAFKTILNIDSSLFEGKKIGPSACSVAAEICSVIIGQVASEEVQKEYHSAKSEAERFRIFDKATYAGASRDIFNLAIKILKYISLAYASAIYSQEFDRSRYISATNAMLAYLRQQFQINYEKHESYTREREKKHSKKNGFLT